ncbi:conjugal transfer protein TraG N-terminal domain-containing protein, partial [Leptospira sp. SA-E8]|uniref:conjugal transfer protein TraG N-terminal domain-containing protein n=1 Tax=Leptospira sp. SA-E8 TaxID=3422259 RepID=UPI003EB98F34
GLVAANNTTKILGGYILFGIWSQSWLLVVAPIQAYIQNSIVDEMTKFFQSSGALTMANYNEFYSLLATKLAAASDIMAMTQTLSLALLTGSIYAMAGVAQKMNAADRTEENLHSSTGGSAALAKQGAVEQQQVMLPSSSSSSSGMVSLSTQAGAGDPKVEQS